MLPLTYRGPHLKQEEWEEKNTGSIRSLCLPNVLLSYLGKLAGVRRILNVSRQAGCRFAWLTPPLVCECVYEWW